MLFSLRGPVANPASLLVCDLTLSPELEAPNCEHLWGRGCDEGQLLRLSREAVVLCRRPAPQSLPGQVALPYPNPLSQNLHFTKPLVILLTPP